MYSSNDAQCGDGGNIGNSNSSHSGSESSNSNSSRDDTMGSIYSFILPSMWDYMIRMKDAIRIHDYIAVMREANQHGHSMDRSSQDHVLENIKTVALDVLRETSTILSVFNSSFQIPQSAAFDPFIESITIFIQHCTSDGLHVMEQQYYRILCHHVFNSILQPYIYRMYDIIKQWAAITSYPAYIASKAFIAIALCHKYCSIHAFPVTVNSLSSVSGTDAATVSHAWLCGKYYLEAAKLLDRKRKEDADSITEYLHEAFNIVSKSCDGEDQKQHFFQDLYRAFFLPPSNAFFPLPPNIQHFTNMNISQRELERICNHQDALKLFRQRQAAKTNDPNINTSAAELKNIIFITVT